MRLFFGSYLFLLSSFVLAQTGTVKGVVLDASTGESIPFANVLIAEINNGFTTDLEGTYSYDLPEGSYTFQVSYVGYSNYRIENVLVKAAETTVINITMSQDQQVLDEVVVLAQQLQDTEDAVLTIQRKSVNVVNGISSQAFRKTGDSNAGSAIKRVTGVSVSDGKYVFVRGLGDRYSKTLLNGMDIPGLDPDRNSLQIDIFPTNILDNIIVSKTATSDLPADFTGGTINIATKEFPDEKKIDVSLGLGYNPDMHFNPNFLSSEQGATDWLGFDNELRNLNVDKRQVFPSPISDPNLTTLTSRFRNNMAAQKMGNFANYNLGVSMGNQFRKKKVTLGYNAVLSYRKTSIFYQDALFNNYIKSADNTEKELLVNRFSQGQLGIDNTLLSAMLGGALKLKKHKISFMLLHLQNGKSTAGLFDQENFIRASNRIVRNNVEYTQSGITNMLLQGSHYLTNTFSIKWKFSPTYSTINDKDVRITPFRKNDDNSLTIEPSEGAQPRRLWRNLTEQNYSSRVDFEKSLSIFGRHVDLKLGIGNTYKERDYEILSYLVDVKGQNSLALSGDPNKLFLPENIWTPEKQTGVYIVANFEPTNTYRATQNTIAAYVMTDISVTDKFKVNVGVRMEKFDQHYTGQNNTGSEVLNNKKIIDNIDFLPAVNLVYQVGKLMNLRASYSATLARPSFKEASIAQIYDALSDRTFIGNINLQQTNINNYDLRWELFADGGQLVSVSGFYKVFANPIELVSYSSSAPDNLQPRNVGNANVIGAEVEFRKNLAFISTHLKLFNIGANLTLLRSEVAMDKSPSGEYNSRTTNQREGESVQDTRQMQGQAPYMVNSYLNYLNLQNGWEVNLSYNVQGRTLSVVGIGLNPDVYTVPYHDLSCRVSKRLGRAKKMAISVGVKNILDSNKTQHYVSYGAEEQIFRQYKPRRTFTLSLSWRL